MSKHKEKATAGKTSGLIELGESVTWEATHFGIKQKLTSKITEFDYPHHFRDSMVKGAFKCFNHDHFFKSTKTGTLMEDVFDYKSPFGFLGFIADKMFLEDYMRKLLFERNQLIKNVAESNNWQKYIKS